MTIFYGSNPQSLIILEKRLDVQKKTIDIAFLLTPIVAADRKLTRGGCGGILGLVYAVSPRLSRYSRGLSEPREILIRFSLYQRM